LSRKGIIIYSYAVDILNDVRRGIEEKMSKQLLNAVAAACIASSMIAAGCGVQDMPAVKDKQLADSGPIVILVENTSISLPVKQLGSDMDRLVEFIRSTLNNILEGKSR
jgi:hypothetical protein